MGKIGKDFKSLIAGEDGTGVEPEDFKTEVANALKEGLITKPEGALLIATKMNADKKGSEMVDSQEKDVNKIKQNEVYNSIEEEIAAKKEKEEKERSAYTFHWRCEDCGNTNFRIQKRAPKWYMHIDKYRCTECKSRNLTVWKE